MNKFLEKGDSVVFKSDINRTIFECQTEQFRFMGKDVVIIRNYDVEVNVEFLEKVEC